MVNKFDNKSVATCSEKLGEVMEALKGLPIEELSFVMKELQNQLSGPIPDGKYLTIDEVCQYLKIGRTTVWRYSKAGILKPKKIGYKILYARADIDEHFNNGMSHEEH